MTAIVANARKRERESQQGQYVCASNRKVQGWL